MFGLKATFGRIPKGPHTEIEPLTAVLGCVTRSVRDTARFFDVCNGSSEYDPFSLPRVQGWEDGLDSFDLAGKKVVVSANLRLGLHRPGRRRPDRGGGHLLIADAGLVRVDVPVSIPRGGLEWAMAGTASLLAGLGTAIRPANRI